MNRRGFLTSIGLVAGSASLSPHIFIPKFEPITWKSLYIAPRELEPVGWRGIRRFAFRNTFGEWKRLNTSCPEWFVVKDALSWEKRGDAPPISVITANPPGSAHPYTWTDE